MAKNRAPLWGQELSNRYNAGIVHAFLIHGNVNDYIGGVAGQTLRNYLVASFGKREIVIYWNRATGFVFAKPAQKRLFAELAGLTAQARSQQGRSGLGAAMNTVAGGVDHVTLIDQAGRQPASALGLIDQALRAQRGETENAVRLAVII